MDQLQAERIVVAKSLLADSACHDRLDALLSRVDGPAPEMVTDQQLTAILATHGVREHLQRGGLERRGHHKELVALARLDGEEVFPGYSWRELRNGRQQAEEQGVLCHSAVEIQSAVGCPFDCTYCPYTSFVCLRVDVEHFVERVTQMTSERRSQRLFKLNNRTDTLGLEPEYGLAPLLVQRFAELEGKYLMLYSKGDEVDALLDLDHQRKTVACFTLTPEPVARLLEQGAPPPAARIEAIGRLARAGYPIRVRFSPIVPLQDWRQAYGNLIDRLYAVANPELVTLWTLSMVEMEELVRIVPEAALDQEIVALARAARERMQGRKGAPFPPGVRAELYNTIAKLLRARSSVTQVSLCLETSEVWDRAASTVVPRAGSDFLCNCGPRATPSALVHLRRRTTA